MGKRSSFEKIPRSCYDTPFEAVVPLLPYANGKFTEPCAGKGQLVAHLELAGLRCTQKSDIAPRHKDIPKRDAMDIESASGKIITNPPWDRKILHPMIEHFVSLAPTWLLLDADWIHTLQAEPYLEKYCSVIISVGRVKWFPGTKHTGKENCCWYFFEKSAGNIHFIPRQRRKL